MYPGYLKMRYTSSTGVITDTEVINNHRVQAYAKNAGVTWLRPCDACSAIGTTVLGTNPPYVLPNKDVMKPPWWDDFDIPGSEQFLGIMGLGFDNADDSTRVVEVTQSLYRGGSLGRMREATRAIVVTGIMVATSDIGMSVGKRWLRTLDSQVAGCITNDLYMYAACPCVCEPDCSDPNCQQQCIQKYYRVLRRGRITRGPEYVRTTKMSQGVMAQVQFTLTLADPSIYGAPIPVQQVIPVDDEWTRIVSPLIPPQPTVPITADQFMPELTVKNVGGNVNNIKVRFLADGVEVHALVIPVIAPGETIKVDYGSRRVFLVGSDSSESLLPAFATAVDGGPLFWPAAALWETRKDFDVEVTKPIASASPQLGGNVAGRWV